MPQLTPTHCTQVLMGHQDVVPVNKDTVYRWTHDPFSGHLDEEGWIWGRGAADCKNTVRGALLSSHDLR